MPDDVEVESVESRDWTEDGNNAKLTFTSDKEIRTAEEALEHGKIDTKTWFVKRMKIGAHQVSMKLRRQTGVDDRGKPIYAHTPVKKSNWKIQLELERIKGNPILDALESVYNRMAAMPARSWPIAKPDKSARQGPCMMSVGLYDCHFAKYAWASESGQDYDLGIAEKIYEHAVADLIDAANGYAVEKFLLVVGNDFFHVDNAQGSTTAGTVVDFDTRYQKMMDVGSISVLRAINTMLHTAPVDVLWVPGNHDWHASYHLCREIKAAFQGCHDVNVDVSPKPRKYYRYHTTVIGHSHGHEEKPSDLTRIMPCEVPADVWAETSCREFHTGHNHKTKVTQTTETDEFAGIRWRMNPALTATDAWHHRRGYVGSTRAAQGLVYSRKSAFRALFEVNPRTS